MEDANTSPVELWTDWRLFEGETAAGVVYSFSQQFPPYGIYVSVSVHEANNFYEVRSIAEHRVAGPNENLVGRAGTLREALLVAEQELHKWERHLLGTIEFYDIKQEYGCFSNFASYPVDLKGKMWPTSEHYFQAQKFPGTEHEEAIRSAKSPAIAARMGRSRARPLRSDWEEIKDDVMREAVLAKFIQHSELGDILLSTGDALLVEHTRNDSYWGDGGDGRGKNMLGKILMQVREMLKAGSGFGGMAG